MTEALASKMSINDDGGELEAFYIGSRVTIRGGGIGGTGFDVQMPAHEAVRFAKMLLKVAEQAVSAKP